MQVQQLIKWREVTDSGATWVNLRDTSGTEIDPRLIRALTITDVVTAKQAGADVWAFSSTQLPATLGQKTGALSLSVVLASDQAVVPTRDVLGATGLQGNVVVGTSAVEAKVGASKLTNRKLLTVFNLDDNVMYWGYTNAVTSSTGTPLYRNSMLTIEASDTTTIFVIASAAAKNIRVTESV